MNQPIGNEYAFRAGDKIRIFLRFKKKPVLGEFFIICNFKIFWLEGDLCLSRPLTDILKIERVEEEISENSSLQY
jgi:hypothetical protein